MLTSDTKKAVFILYTNYRGETAPRRIIPKSIRFAASEWHPEEQWLMDAFDIDKNAERSFALKDILKWHGSLNEQPQVSENDYEPKAG
jgi:hypothetical protein